MDGKLDLQYLAYLRQERSQFIAQVQERFILNSKNRTIVENIIIAYDSMMLKYIEQKELADFAKRVEDVRTAQSKYFAQRTQAHLDASKSLERRLDSEIKEIKKRAKRDKPQAVQSLLF